MPHTAREISGSGYYHVVPKGIADQLIFENSANRKLYLELLEKVKHEYALRLHAYVLMSNHVHLLLEDPKCNLSDAMKYLHERYAMYYAELIGRTGGIFRKPYWSEPVTTDNHLLCALRYIHANPVAAGLCRASAYDWSSAKDYLGRDGITDTQMVLSMLGGRNGFIEWSKAKNGTAIPFIGSKLKGHMTDDEALIVAREILGNGDTSLCGVHGEKRHNAILLLHERGFTNNQIARITGLGRNTISRALAR